MKINLSELSYTLLLSIKLHFFSSMDLETTKLNGLIDLFEMKYLFLNTQKWFLFKVMWNLSQTETQMKYFQGGVDIWLLITLKVKSLNLIKKKSKTAD